MNNETNLPENQNKEITISEVVKSILDETLVLPDSILEKLSFISQPNLTKIIGAWQKISAKRKLFIMGQLEEISSIDPLLSFENFCISTLDDGMEEIRRISIRTLWDTDNIALVPILIDILKNDQAAGPRGEAATVLGQFIFLGELEKITKPILKEVEDSLLTILEDESEELFVRQRCLESMGYSGRSEISDIIESMYFQNDDDWLASSLLAMGRSTNERWNDLVLDKLEHSNSIVKLEAIKAAGELAIPDAELSLFSSTQDPEKDIRLATAWALSEIGGKEARISIENMLVFSDDEEETELVEQAIENLNFNAELNNFSFLDFSEPPDEPE